MPKHYGIFPHNAETSDCRNCVFFIFVLSYGRRIVEAHQFAPKFQHLTLRCTPRKTVCPHLGLPAGPARIRADNGKSMDTEISEYNTIHGRIHKRGGGIVKSHHRCTQVTFSALFLSRMYTLYSWQQATVWYRGCRLYR